MEIIFCSTIDIGCRLPIEEFFTGLNKSGFGPVLFSENKGFKEEIFV